MKKTTILLTALAAAITLIVSASVPRSTYRSKDIEVSFAADSVRITTGRADRTYPCGLYDGEFIQTSREDVYMRLNEDESLDLVIDGRQTTLRRTR